MASPARTARVLLAAWPPRVVYGEAGGGGGGYRGGQGWVYTCLAMGDIDIDIASQGGWLAVLCLYWAMPLPAKTSTSLIGEVLNPTWRTSATNHWLHGLVPREHQIRSCVCTSPRPLKTRKP